MKKTKKVETNTTFKCSKSHKFWAAFSLFAIFVCGFILGGIYYGKSNKDISIDPQKCDAIAQEIINITSKGATEEDVDILRKLNDTYSSGCAGRLVIIDKNETLVQNSSQPADIIATCSRIEQLLKTRLYPEDQTEAWKHTSNAYTYSTLAEKGCAENADMYKALALREIEITTALQTEENMQLSEVETVIDTYKKLNMQREAQAFLDKVEKLSEPAIDFILKMEKIINE